MTPRNRGLGIELSGIEGSGGSEVMLNINGVSWQAVNDHISEHAEFASGIWLHPVGAAGVEQCGVHYPIASLFIRLGRPVMLGTSVVSVKDCAALRHYRLTVMFVRV